MTKTERKVMEAFWNSHQQDRAYWHRDGVAAAALRKVVEELKYIGITEKNILELANDLNGENE